MAGARTFQLHGSADAAKSEQQHQRGAGGDDEAPLRRHAQGGDGARHADQRNAQTGPRLARRGGQQGRAGHAGKRVRIGRGRRDVDVFFIAAPKNDGGDQHQDTGNAKGDRWAVVAQENGHQQGGEEGTEIDDPVKHVKHQFGPLLVALVKLVAHEGRHQWFDAAGTECNQEQAEVESLDVAF